MRFFFNSCPPVYAFEAWEHFPLYTLRIINGSTSKLTQTAASDDTSMESTPPTPKPPLSSILKPATHAHPHSSDVSYNAFLSNVSMLFGVLWGGRRYKISLWLRGAAMLVGHCDGCVKLYWVLESSRMVLGCWYDRWGLISFCPIWEAKGRT